MQGVDLAIDEGSFVIVFGTNGSGKSTLLNAVAGTFFPDSDRILLGDRDITRLRDRARAAFIGANSSLSGLSGVPCKDGDLQWVRVPPGNWSLQPEAIGAVGGGNESR